MASANDDEQQEILLLPFFGQGHLFPFTELCRHLSKRNYKITLAISSFLSSSIPSSLTRDLPNLQIAHLPATSMDKDNGMGGDPLRRQQDDMNQGIESLLSGSGSVRPACAVIDVMMSWSKDVFARFNVPTVAFFTSGACSAAMEYATWKAHVDDLKPREIRYLPSLPDEMAVSYTETKRGGPPPPPMDNNILPPGAGGPPGAPPHGGGPGFHPPPHGGGRGLHPPPHGGGPGFHPPPPPMRPGGPPMWLQETQECAALLMNTCHDLEGLFLEYVAAQVGKPVWGVGPLLPEEYWRSAGSILHDREVRPKKDSSHSEEQVISWLDSKPTASVLYVSFGTEVGPSVEEYAQLATALEESNTPFIWVIRPGAGQHGPPPGFVDTNSKSGGGTGAGAGGYYPHGLDAKVGNRGLIIHGWAPQLLILTHPSTGGFLSHCGWNSTVEAIGRGVPILAWPIRGDQFHNAKLVVSHLKIGHMVLDNDSSEMEMVKIDDIARGVDRLMADQQLKNRASLLRTRFQSGFPKCSDAALDAFRDFLATGAYPTRTN